MATINMFDKRTINVDNIPLQEGQILIGKDATSAEIWYDFNSTQYENREGEHIIRAKISGGGGGGSATRLNELEDVNLASPSANQVLTYNGTKWINKEASAGASNLAELNDVNVIPGNNYILTYDSSSSKWVASDIAINGHTLEGSKSSLDYDIYDKATVDMLIEASGAITVVDTLPSFADRVPRTLYYVRTLASGIYDVYLCKNDKSTEYLGNTSVDLTNYVAIVDIVDDVLTSASNKPLSARMGKKLADEKVNITDIVDDVVTASSLAPLSANQGKKLNEKIGNLDQLETAHRTNTVVAINDVVAEIGDLTDLTTTDKDSVVEAINELDGEIGDLTDLNTPEVDTLVEAIDSTLANYSSDRTESIEVYYDNDTDNAKVLSVSDTTVQVGNLAGNANNVNIGNRFKYDSTTDVADINGNKYYSQPMVDKTRLQLLLYASEHKLVYLTDVKFTAAESPTLSASDSFIVDVVVTIPKAFITARTINGTYVSSSVDSGTHWTSWRNTLEAHLPVNVVALDYSLLIADNEGMVFNLEKEWTPSGGTTPYAPGFYRIQDIADHTLDPDPGAIYDYVLMEFGKKLFTDLEDVNVREQSNYQLVACYEDEFINFTPVDDVISEQDSLGKIVPKLATDRGLEKVDETTNKGIGIKLANDSGIEVDTDGLAIKLATDCGLEVNSDNELTTVLDPDGGIESASTGLYVNVDNDTTHINGSNELEVKLDISGGLAVGDNGLKIKTGGSTNAGKFLAVDSTGNTTEWYNFNPKLFVTGDYRTPIFDSNIDSIVENSTYSVYPPNASGTQPWTNGWYFLQTFTLQANSNFRTQVAYNCLDGSTVLMKIRRKDTNGWGSWVFYRDMTPEDITSSVTWSTKLQGRWGSVIRVGGKQITLSLYFNLKDGQTIAPYEAFAYLPSPSISNVYSKLQLKGVNSSTVGSIYASTGNNTLFVEDETLVSGKYYILNLTVFV